MSNPWWEIGGEVARSRPWLIGMDMVQASISRGELLRDLGATDLFGIGAGMGTGPAEADFPTVCLGVQANGMMAAIRASENALDDLPPELVTKIDAWDPNRRASAYRVFFSEGRPLAGRTTYGARPQAWQALEDKTVIDEFWDDAGIPRAPFQILSSADLAPGLALDRGAGVVFSGDSRDGFNGGASYVRWVRDGDLEEASAFFAAHCDRVRAMPFLEGLPCSIHAFVTATGIAVFRPCEMLVFRRPGRSTFQYASVATSWQAAPAVMDSMRALARKTAQHLTRTFAYRGVFTLDGVLTSDGFVPTELNPRVGAGVGPLMKGLEMPMELLHFAAIEEHTADWQLEALETRVCENPARGVRCGVLVTKVRPPRNEEVDGFQVELGAAPGGAGYLRIRADLPPGPPVGPRVVELLAKLDRDWDLGIGTLESGRLPA